MDFSNERYVRLYVRETTTFRLLTWEGQALMPHILRLVDRSGVLELGDVNPIDALILALPRWPAEVIGNGLTDLVQRKVVELAEDAILWPRFIKAQETPDSSAKRNKEWRETKRINGETIRLASETKRTLSEPEEKEEPEERKERAVKTALTHELNIWFDGTFVPAYPPHRQGTQTKSAKPYVLRTLRPDEAARAKIMRHLAAWKASYTWTKEGGRFVPGQKTFFVDGYCDHDPGPADAAPPPKGSNGPGGPQAYLSPSGRIFDLLRRDGVRRDVDWKEADRVPRGWIEGYETPSGRVGILCGGTFYATRESAEGAVRKKGAQREEAET